MADITYVDAATLLARLGPAYQQAYGQPIPSQIQDVPLLVEFKTKETPYLQGDTAAKTVSLGTDKQSEAICWTFTQTDVGGNPGFFITPKSDTGLWLNGDATVNLAGSQTPWQLTTDGETPGSNLYSAGANQGYAAPGGGEVKLVDFPNNDDKCFVGIWGPA